MKLRYILLAALIATSPILAQEEEPPKRTISVSGNAVGYAVPDTIVWNVEISTSHEDVIQAKKASDERVKKLLVTLQEMGINKAQVDTGLILIRSNSDKKSSTRFSKATTITRTITIQQTQLSDFAEMMKALGTAGNYKIKYSFISSKFEDVNRDTIAKAVGAAKAKAEAMAQTAGATVVRVLQVYEYPPPDWDVSPDTVPRDIPASVLSPDAKTIAHTIYAVFELE